MAAADSDTFVGSDIPSAAIKQNQFQTIHKALAALEQQSVDEREISSTVFSVDKKDIPKMKDRIRKFRLDLATEFTRSKTKNTVYNLSIQLFDLLEKDRS